MAQKGRKPKPMAMKQLEGNPGKRKLNSNEPEPGGKGGMAQACRCNGGNGDFN